MAASAAAAAILETTKNRFSIIFAQQLFPLSLRLLFSAFMVPQGTSDPIFSSLALSLSPSLYNLNYKQREVGMVNDGSWEKNIFSSCCKKRRGWIAYDVTGGSDVHAWLLTKFWSLSVDRRVDFISWIVLNWTKNALS